MNGPHKHSPQVTDTESILDPVPQDRMGEFVDRLLRAVPLQKIASTAGRSSLTPKLYAEHLLGEPLSGEKPPES
jgi:hypothetical protein